MAESQTDCENVITESSKQDGKQMDQAEAGGVSAVEVKDDDDGSFMCPVCSDGFVVPKLLPCGHLVCQLCMLHWLNAKGPKATCPFCRLRILVSDEADDDVDDDDDDDYDDYNGDDEIDVYEEVCTRPTDFFTEAVAEAHRLLQELHICGSCDVVPAVSYCMQCCKKLCRKCVRSHKQIPATRKHPRVNLSCLTAEKLAGTRPVMCESHPDRLAEVYCPDHEKVICRKCGSTGHKRCADKNMVEDLERGTKAELQRRVESLKLKTTELAKKVKDVKFFKAHRSKIMYVFKSLPNMTSKQIMKFERILEVNNKLFMTSLLALEKAQTVLIQNDTTMSNLVQSTSGVALLKTLEPLKMHLDHLERKAEESIEILPEISFGEEELNHLKEAVAVLESTELDDTRTEAWICLTVENSRLEERVYSPMYRIRNQLWEINVSGSPNSFENEGNLCVSLKCHTEPKCGEWFYIAQPDFYIRDSRSGRHRILLAKGRCFSEKTRWCLMFVPWKSIMNHITDDRITVEVHVKVHPLNVKVPQWEMPAETRIPGAELLLISERTPPVRGTVTTYVEFSFSSDDESYFDDNEEHTSESEFEEPDRERERV